MSVKTFVDTNVLVYAHDLDDLAKHDLAKHALREAQIEALVNEDEAFEQAKNTALALLDQGFHLGGRHRIDRAALHER